jgi:hypothetical protein
MAKLVKKQVHIKIVSRSGHDEWEGEGGQALEKIIAETGNGKWAYIDGKFVDPEMLNVKMLEEAEDITLTNSLYGGK